MAAGARPTIVHVTTGLRDGGAEAVLTRLCLHELVCRHVVVSLMGRGKYADVLEAHGIHVEALALTRVGALLSGLGRLRRLLRHLQPTVVQTWMYHANLLGGLAARSTGQRHVVWGIRHSTHDAATTRWSTRVVAWACARLSAVVPEQIVCAGERARVVHQAAGYPAARLVSIPNGIDLADYADAPEQRHQLRAGWGITPDMPLIGMVARWDPQKDHRSLLDALQRVAASGRRFHTLLVGHGIDPAQPAWRDALRAHGLTERVTLVGARADVPAVLQALDLHVLSSAYGEAFPNAVLEALASGVPCVVTDVGDAARLVDDAGWVVPPRHPAALAEAISVALDAMRDGASWQARRAASRERSAPYTLDRMCAAYRAVWGVTDAPSADEGASPNIASNTR